MNRWNPYLQYPATALALTLLAAVPLGVGVAHLRVDSDATVLLRSDPRKLESYEKVRQFLGDKNVLVVSMACRDVFSRRGIDAIRRVSEAFLRQEGAVDVKSLTHSYKPVRKGFSFQMVPFVPPEVEGKEERERLRSSCLSNPLVRNVMVSPDARHTSITVTYDRDWATIESKRAFRAEVLRILQPFKQEGFAFHLIALPLVEEEVYTSLVGDAKRFLPSVMAAVLLILVIAFRSFAMVLFVFASQVVVLLVLAAGIQRLGFTYNLFSLLLVPLWAGIHLTLLIHIGTAFQRAMAEGADPDPVETMLRRILRSCGFALLTTAAGLMSLSASGIAEVRDAGLQGAIGVGVIFLFSFGPGVACLRLLERWYRRRGLVRSWGRPAKRAAPRRSLARSFTGWVERYRVGILIAGGTLFGLSLLGTRLLRTDVRLVEFLSPHSETRQSAEYFMKHYGGMNVVQIAFDSRAAGGVNRIGFLKYLEDVGRFAASQDEVTAAYSYADVLAMMHQIWQGDKPEALELPESPFLLNLFTAVLKTQRLPYLHILCDDKFQTAFLVVRTPDLRAKAYLGVLDRLLNYAEERKPEGVRISAREGIHSILAADRRMVRSQIRTAGLSLLVVWLLLVFLWRSFALATAAVVTNAIPVVLVLAIAGACDIPLNTFTVMVAALAFGIAVDDSVHFITFWRQRRLERLNWRDATIETLQTKGRPIIFTSWMLIAIFLLLGNSSFPPIVHFSWLTALAFGGALLAVLGYLPALLYYKRRPV